MSIQIKYFASLRDELGRDGDELASDVLNGTSLTVAGLWQRLWPDTPLPANTLIAINQEYSEREQTLRDGDEVAFFPPVTGG